MDCSNQTVLLIIDGWGIAESSSDNAFSIANTPTLDSLLNINSKSYLECSGKAVGLLDGLMGNSEVGHLTIGSGRTIYQDITTIEMAIENNTFANNNAIKESIKAAKSNNSTLHLIGLLSDGGVHSHIDHLVALIKAAKKEQTKTALHIITDGRDTSPNYCLNLLQNITPLCDENICIASISGRYYPMDRDNHWERIELYYKCLFEGNAEVFESAEKAIETYYKQELTDEFILPSLIKQANGQVVTIKPNDSVFLFNFRADRMRQLAKVFVEQDFNSFKVNSRPKLSFIASMTRYDQELDIPVAFTKPSIKNTLGEVISSYGYKQLRLAETEKYAHVTYFFNGGVELPFASEDRKLIPSPRDVSTYDQKPEMSAYEVTKYLIDKIKTNSYQLYVCNLANLDMVGHTGNLDAAIKACECVDNCVKDILNAVVECNAKLVVTADHGNVEDMLNNDGSKNTAHTRNKVPFIVYDPKNKYKILPQGGLKDIAPTLLDIMNINKPSDMTGISLLEK